MSSSNPMTREELLESAALDAFGLLDEYEAALFTRSFHHAPAAVQDEIIQLQAQIVTNENFLPEEQPTPALRGKVLEAVAVAIEQETAELEPLATIGRGRLNTNERPETPVLSSSRHYWRAATFALVGGLIVVLYLMANVSSKYDQIALIALQNNTDGQLEKLIGPTAKDYILASDSTYVQFKATNAGGDVGAAMFYGEDHNGLLVIDRLPASPLPVYTLSIRDAQGNIESVQQFSSPGKLSGVRIALGQFASKLQNASFEITDAGGTVLLVSV